MIPDVVVGGLERVFKIHTAQRSVCRAAELITLRQANLSHFSRRSALTRSHILYKNHRAEGSSASLVSHGHDQHTLPKYTFSVETGWSWTRSRDKRFLQGFRMPCTRLTRISKCSKASFNDRRGNTRVVRGRWWVPRA